MVRGKVAVGMMECPPATLDMAVLLSEFHADHPGAEVALRSGGSDRMLEDVRAGDLDFAILGLPPTPLDDRLTARTLLIEDLVGLVEVGHRLRTRARATSLAEEVFVDFPPGYGLREQTDHCFAEAGIDRKVGFEVVRVEEMIRFATLGLGIAVLPRSIAAAIGRRVRRRHHRRRPPPHRRPRPPPGRPPLRRRPCLLRPRRCAPPRYRRHRYEQISLLF
ncbi:MAG TPA: LysR substrate-binding domain-containing protein [Solirubrobacterales bacterium]